jgi:hypothetical protein
MKMMPDSKTILLLETEIGGQRQANDFTVFWRGTPIGRIMKSTGILKGQSYWWWGCNVNDRPSLEEDSGTGVDLDACIGMFMIAWERIHARMTEEDDLAKVREAAAQAQATAVDL